MSLPSLSIIIVNWNSGAQLRECLESVARSRMDGWRLESVVVVDNASTDGSLAGIGELGLPLRVLTNSSNRGFAAACNQGAGESRADYLLFLNPDCRVEPDAIDKMVAFMECSPEVGIAGPQLVDERGEISRSCARFPSLRTMIGRATGLDHLVPSLFPPHFLKEWNHGDTRLVDQIMGACFLVRGNLFRLLSGFDERFFVYFEEVDFSFRASALGWSSAYLHSAQVFHRGCGTSEQARADRLFYSLQSRLRYAKKHFGPVAALTVALVTLFWEPVPRLVLALARRAPEEAGEVLIAYARLWSALLRGGRRSGPA